MGDDMGWKLVTLDDHKKGRLAPEICQRVLRSAWFRMLTMIVILANGLCMASMNFKHNERPREYFYEHYYYIEVSVVVATGFSCLKHKIFLCSFIHILTLLNIL